MAFNNKNSVNEINNDGTFVVAAGSFATKDNLPAGATAGYLAYVQDSQYLALNVGSGTWRTFQTRAMDYKNEVILEQGTVGGGYSSSGVFNYISKIHYASDANIQLLPTLSFATKYGGWHSTYLYAYYHQGDDSNGTGACKQDWATMTVGVINSRPTCGGTFINSTQQGPKQQNTIGVIMKATASCYLNFSTDAWTSGGYSTGLVDETYGYATFGANYGYTNGDGGSNVYRLTWGTATWAATGSGTGSYGTYAKALNTKWDKWFQGGSGSNILTYLNASDSFTASGGAAPSTFQEQETLMGQDFGYWSGYIGGYSTTTFKTDYSTETTATAARGAFNYGHSSGSGCWGPIP